jgi:transposase
MLYCGIDVAKHKHAVALLNEKAQILRPAFTITNNRAGFDQLRQVLQEIAGPLTIGLEATGHYWLALYEELIQLGAWVTVIVLNSLQVAAYRKSGVRKVKNDRSDAIWITDFVRIANLPPPTGTCRFCCNCASSAASATT